MKLSEFIKQAQLLLEIAGDREVMIPHAEYHEGDTVWSSAEISTATLTLDADNHELDDDTEYGEYRTVHVIVLL